MIIKNKINPLFITFALLFILTLPFHPYPFCYLIKAVPAALASIGCFLIIKNRTDSLLMGIGFLFCMAGDIFLDLNRELFFVQGLGSFLAGHVFFSILFIRKFSYSFTNAIKAGFVLLYIIILAFILIPHLGSLFIPVVAYMCVIGIMGISAAFLKNASPYIFIGASLFVFSDSIIALTKFLFPFQASHYFIMFFYFSAIFFIQFGALKEYGDSSQKID
ncbi:MAG: lysoplasmalogenase [Desulfobacteraceae bacterium]|nr:lysoplasmalogenase [Desulfobacteraceae bacterium]